jgi:hypothetical protein
VSPARIPMTRVQTAWPSPSIPLTHLSPHLSVNSYPIDLEISRAPLTCSRPFGIKMVLSSRERTGSLTGELVGFTDPETGSPSYLPMLFIPNYNISIHFIGDSYSATLKSISLIAPSYCTQFYARLTYFPLHGAPPSPQVHP